MQGAPIEVLIDQYVARGMSVKAASQILAARSPDMGRAILALYRSAAQRVMRRLDQRLHEADDRPGLALVATEDPFCGGEKLACRTAKRIGAEIMLLEGAGHWWMCQLRPQVAADAINRFLCDRA